MTIRVTLMAIGAGSTPHDPMTRPDTTSDSVESQRIPMRRPIQPASTKPGISAKAPIPNVSATSEGCPPSSTIRMPTKSSAPCNPMEVRVKTASTAHSRGWTARARLTEPNRPPVGSPSWPFASARTAGSRVRSGALPRSTNRTADHRSETSGTVA